MKEHPKNLAESDTRRQEVKFQLGATESPDDDNNNNIDHNQSRNNTMVVANRSQNSDSDSESSYSDLNVLGRFRRNCGAAVNHPKVQVGIVILIAINALLMGVATFDFVKEDPTNERAFEITDMVFLIIFTIELGLQFIHRGWRLITDGWLVFDLVVILASWSFADLQIIRAFRIFRALRLITRIQVMQNLVMALFGVMPRMFAIGLLLFLVSYIFAVMFTQLFKDLYKDGKTDQDYFGRLDETFYTLFQIMTFDGWPDIARQVMKVYPWAWLPFITFVILTSFVVVNLIIAVICDSIAALRDDEKAKLHGQQSPTKGSSNTEFLSLRESLAKLEERVEQLNQTQDETLHAMDTLVEHLKPADGDE